MSTEAEKFLEQDPSTKEEFWIDYAEPSIAEASDEAIELLAERIYVRSDSFEPSDAFRKAERFYEYSRSRYIRNHREAWRQAKLRDMATSQAEGAVR